MHTSVTSRTIGKYQIVDRIGVGGMGEVFRARQTGEGGFIKYIALKSLLPQRSSDHEYLRRFLQEAKIVGRLSHQNIVQVFDTFPEEGVWYIVMELVDGHDLGNLLLRCATSREPVPQVWVAYVLSEALRGLDHAHKKADEAGRPFGIVHRDISPENILISYDGSVKVTDFGVAKGWQQPTGMYLVGKPRYMSPEQARGGPIDGRADVYSAGVVLWEAMAMTAAAVAGDEWNPAAFEPPPIGQPFPVIPSTPAPLTAAIAKATKANPDERYPDAEAFAADLRRFVAKEMPDFSPMDLGRFVAQKFSDEHTQRLDNLRQFEQTAGIPPGKRLTPTIVSQKRRAASGPDSLEITAPSVKPLDVGHAPDGSNGAMGKPSPTVVARTPAPEAVHGIPVRSAASDSSAAVRPGGGTDLAIREFKKAGQRKVLLIGGILLGATAIAGGVYAFQTRSAGKPIDTPSSTLPPVLPTLEPPTKSGDAPTATTQTPTADEDEDTDESGTTKTTPANPPTPTEASKLPTPTTTSDERNEHHVASVTKKLASLLVETVPEGASLRVNGKVQKQRSPFTVKGIPVGHKVSVEVSMAGYAPEERQAVINEGSNTLRVELRGLEGLIRIEQLPPGARVMFDGQSTLVNPIPAKTGHHRIDVSAPGYQPSSREVSLSPGQVLNVPMPLAPIPTGPGTLEVRCRPFCKLLVDGKDNGVVEAGTPYQMKVDAGDHKVEARQVQSARRKTQKVSVKSGETTSVAFDLSD